MSFVRPFIRISANGYFEPEDHNIFGTREVGEDGLGFRLPSKNVRSGILHIILRDISRVDVEVDDFSPLSERLEIRRSPYLH